MMTRMAVTVVYMCVYMNHVLLLGDKLLISAEKLMVFTEKVPVFVGVGTKNFFSKILQNAKMKSFIIIVL